ncbi:hypothetical protein CWI84_08730 [Idiomarina tyrosinivorans]|uniref:Uncharacterized protein n=1 Tax=Idiomarina tyrosinivorans TaxID=1445662 RepID=A0A432ZQ80_9GAMM|nr:hypothetical protein CWI84_08730 [Idiomarina tyrosinivorans]
MLFVPYHGDELEHVGIVRGQFFTAAGGLGSRHRQGWGKARGVGAGVIGAQRPVGSRCLR